MKVEANIYYMLELRITPAAYAMKQVDENGNTMVTMDVWKGLRFKSKEDAEKWCTENGSKAFSVVEHIFYDEV